MRSKEIGPLEKKAHPRKKSRMFQQNLTRVVAINVSFSDRSINSLIHSSIQLNQRKKKKRTSNSFTSAIINIITQTPPDNFYVFSSGPEYRKM